MKRLRRRRLWLQDARNLDIENLLIVAGPSGSGKSTFLRMLAEGGLSIEIMSALPAGASRWPQTSGSYIDCDSGTQIGASKRGLRLSGLVLHYDFLRILDSLIPDYAHDPALSALKAARNVAVVTIRPAPNALVAQIQRKSMSRGRIHQLERRLRRLLRRIIRPRHRFIYNAPAGRHLRLVDLYRSPEFLDSWFEAWNHFITVQSGERLVQNVSVEPIELAGSQGFRLIG